VALAGIRPLTVVVALALPGLLTACRSGGDAAAQRPSPTPLRRVADGRWPQFFDDLDPAGFVEAAGHAASYLDDLPPGQSFRFGAEERTAAELAQGIRKAADIVAATGDPADRIDALRADFVLLSSIGRDDRGEVLITGYYEPLIEARRVPEPPFIHPVYGVPDDLVTADLAAFGVAGATSSVVGRVVDGELVPYPDRSAIDRGDALPAGTDVLGYLADPVDVFFLQVQGSGTLVFDDGRRVRAGFAVSNGRSYRSIGKLLIEEGSVPAAEMSMQAIRRYLHEHPEELDRVLSYNPRYVFFRRRDPEGGPLGCFGTPVTAGRSIATDLRLLPAPVVALLDGSLPSIDGGDRRFARLVVHQDTGSSIVGPGRVDLFFGAGAKAGELAGRTKHLGRLYVLLPRRR
jgi:membrane-bound lytic murein transglycosylase A